jgi:hypothetical protein
MIKIITAKTLAALRAEASLVNDIQPVPGAGRSSE